MDNSRIGPRYGSYSNAGSSQPRDIPGRSRGPSDDSWGPSPSRSAAIGIPGGGGRRRRDSFDSISSSESEDDRRPPPRSSMAPRNNNLPRPQGFDTYHHTTDRRHVPSIRRDGLEAGHHVGIGTPDNHSASTNGVYVVNPGQRIRDSRGSSVMVVSSREPQRDPNYHGEAGVFLQSNVPPLREARRRRGPQPTHSAVFPMTPYTASGAAAMIRHHNPDMHLSPEDAAAAMYSQHHQNFPMHAQRPDDPSRYYTPQSEYQQSLAPSVPGYSNPVSGISYNTPPSGSFFPPSRHPNDPYYDRNR